MKIPQLRKIKELKSCHNITWEDDYSWIHQKNILEVLQDKKKLNPEVENYLNQENAYTEHHLKDTKTIQKKLVQKMLKKYGMETKRKEFSKQIILVLEIYR